MRNKVAVAVAIDIAAVGRTQSIEQSLERAREERQQRRRTPRDHRGQPKE